MKDALAALVVAVMLVVGSSGHAATCGSLSAITVAIVMREALVLQQDLSLAELEVMAAQLSHAEIGSLTAPCEDT